MAIKITAPIRIDFCALSDSPPFVDEYGGFTLNVAINYRVSTMIRGGIKTSSKENIPEAGGLGSSGALRVTDLAAQNPELLDNPEKLIRAAWDYANNCVGQRGGWQDECSAVYGGFNLWAYKRNKKTGLIDTKRIEIPKNKVKHLEERLVLVSAGGPSIVRRESSNIHDLIFGPENYEKNIPHLKEINILTKKMAEDLLDCSALDFPELMTKIWAELKALHPTVESENMKILQGKCCQFYSSAKATGAGGDGSCMLFYSAYPTKDSRQELIKKINECNLPGVEVIPFKFEYKGIRREY